MPHAAGCYYNYSPLGKASNPPLLFIHGAGGSSLGWHTRLRRMPERTVYALDLPGHGKSEGEGCQSLIAYARVILDFMQAVGVYKTILIGHSLGGMIALQTALLSPDRVAGSGGGLQLARVPGSAGNHPGPAASDHIQAIHGLADWTAGGLLLRSQVGGCHPAGSGANPEGSLVWRSACLPII